MARYRETEPKVASTRLPIKTKESYPIIKDPMMKLCCLPLILVAACMTASPARGQQNTERGAVLGGLTGGLAGAAIGKQNGETGAGALVGGAIGLMTGALIGNAKDEEIARGRAQAYYQQQMAYRQARAVSPADVVNMTQNGLSEQVIITHIRQNGVQYQPQVADIIALHQQGVSQNVITAMQQASLPAAPVPTAVIAPAPRYTPVIVEQYRYVAPPCYARPYPYYYRPYYGGHHHHHGSGLHWGISIGH
jgi:uncharacterized protein YcfJ